MHSKTTHHCAFFLLLPAACAVLLRRAEITSWAVKYLHPWVAIALSLPLLAFTQDGNPLSALAPLLLISGTVLHPDSWTGRLLETAFMRFVGKISFGLYLWQQLFFTTRFLGASFRPFGLLNAAPWNLLATFAIATASYYLLERPCMRLGHRLARPATAGRTELQSQGKVSTPHQVESGEPWRVTVTG
jgi:peptidoglycan/LPS O-acetylase OafA/YrhL